MVWSERGDPIGLFLEVDPSGLVLRGSRGCGLRGNPGDLVLRGSRCCGLIGGSR